MEDLLKKYGGIKNLKKHLNFFYKKVSEEKRIKHYFFGIDVKKCHQRCNKLSVIYSA